MTMLLILTYALILAVSAIYAIFLSVTAVGRWLASERTWLSVVIGVGYVTLAMRILGPAPAWWQWLVAWGVSSVPIIARSLYHELRREQELWQRERER